MRCSPAPGWVAALQYLALYVPDGAGRGWLGGGPEHVAHLQAGGGRGGRGRHPPTQLERGSLPSYGGKNKKGQQQLKLESQQCWRSEMFIRDQKNFPSRVPESNNRKKEEEKNEQISCLVNIEDYLIFGTGTEKDSNLWTKNLST